VSAAARRLRAQAPPLPDLRRLTHRDWLRLGCFATYKVALTASVLYVWVHIWRVLIELQGEVLLLVYCLLVFPTLVYHWRPLLRAWRKASMRVMSPPLLIEVPRAGRMLPPLIEVPSPRQVVHLGQRRSA
jgi:hypothetical protein